LLSAETQIEELYDAVKHAGYATIIFDQNKTKVDKLNKWQQLKTLLTKQRGNEPAHFKMWKRNYTFAFFQ